MIKQLQRSEILWSKVVYRYNFELTSSSTSFQARLTWTSITRKWEGI